MYRKAKPKAQPICIRFFVLFWFIWACFFAASVGVGGGMLNKFWKTKVSINDFFFF